MKNFHVFKQGDVKILPHHVLHSATGAASFFSAKDVFSAVQILANHLGPGVYFVCPEGGYMEAVRVTSVSTLQMEYV